MSTETFLTVSELAAQLRVKPATLRQIAARGEISFHRVGRAIRFHLDDVEAFLAKQYRPARSERGARAAVR